MTDVPLRTETESDPCEKCGTPVIGWVDERCCDGRECGCMGRSTTPCWCEKCWDAWEADSKQRAAESRVTFAQMLEDAEHEEQP